MIYSFFASAAAAEEESFSSASLALEASFASAPKAAAFSSNYLM